MPSGSSDNRGSVRGERQRTHRIILLFGRDHSSVPAVRLRSARRAGPSQGRREAPPAGLVLDWPSTVLSSRPEGREGRTLAVGLPVHGSLRGWAHARHIMVSEVVVPNVRHAVTCSGWGKGLQPLKRALHDPRPGKGQLYRRRDGAVGLVCSIRRLSLASAETNGKSRQSATWRAW